MMAARPPSLPPAATSELHSLPRDDDFQVPRVFIRHPGYNEPLDLLFHLPALDTVPLVEEANPEAEVEATVGIHHRTVLTAGAIIANNAFDIAYLSYDQAGQRRVDEQVPLDGILLPGDYWLHVPATSIHDVDAQAFSESDPMPPPSRPSSATTSPHLYPVIPNFESWPFPHNKLPAPWIAAHEPAHLPPPPSPRRNTVLKKISQQKPEVQPCCITAHRSGREQAHIIPQIYSHWFLNNGMNRYAPRRQSIHDLANILPLRADIHYSFDQFRFIIVPKPTSPNPTTGERPRYALAVHMLKAEELEDVALYHNLALQTYSDDRNTREYISARPFLFVRFALAMFGQLVPFLQSATRHVLVPSQPGAQAVPGSLVPSLQTWAQIQARLKSPSRSHSGSRKRSASQISRQDDTDYYDQADGADDAELRRCTRWRENTGYFSATDRCGYDVFNDGALLDADSLAATAARGDSAMGDDVRGRPRRQSFSPDALNDCNWDDVEDDAGLSYSFSTDTSHDRLDQTAEGMTHPHAREDILSLVLPGSDKVAARAEASDGVVDGEPSYSAQ